MKKYIMSVLILMITFSPQLMMAKSLGGPQIQYMGPSETIVPFPNNQEVTAPCENYIIGGWYCSHCFLENAPQCGGGTMAGSTCVNYELGEISIRQLLNSNRNENANSKICI